MGKDHSYVRPSTDDGEGLGFLRSRQLSHSRQRSNRDGEQRRARGEEIEGQTEMVRIGEVREGGGVRKQ